MLINPRPFALAQLSVSQLELLARCPRRWWFRRVCGLKEEETAAKTAGTESHALLEHTVTRGEDVLGPMESPARPFLPRPGEPVFCEWGFDDRPRPAGQHWHPAGDSLLHVAGVPFVGFIDLWHATGTFIDSDGTRKSDPPDSAEVIDYKTTSSIQRNSKAGFMLPKTIQMAGYNAWIHARVPSAKWIRDSHVYIQTKGAPRAEKRTTLITVDSALEIWEKLSSPLVSVALHVSQESVQSAVPHNPDDCESYGRQCSYFAVCTRKGEKMSFNLVEKLRATKGASDAISPALSKPAAPPTSASPPMRIIDESTSPDRPRVGTVVTGPMAPERPAAVASPTPTTTLPPGASYIQSPVPLTVGSRLETGELVAADLTGGNYLIMAAPAPPASRRNPETGASEFYDAATGAYQSEPPTPTVASIDVPKRGRGRPPKSANAPAPVEKVLAPVAAPAETPRTFVPAARFGDYVSALATELASECGLDDIRLALDGGHALAFGRWKGALAAMCRESPPAAGGYLVDLSSELEAVAFEALAPRAAALGLVLYVGCFPIAPGIVRAR